MRESRCWSNLKSKISGEQGEVAAIDAALMLLMQDSVAAVEAAFRQLQKLMPGYDLSVPGRLSNLHVWQNFVSCLAESRLW